MRGKSKGYNDIEKIKKIVRRNVRPFYEGKLIKS